MKKKVVFLLNSEIAEEWFVNLIKYLEDIAEIKIQIYTTKKPLVSVYKFFSKVLIKLEQLSSKTLRTKLFQKDSLSSYINNKIEIEECVIKLNLTGKYINGWRHIEYGDNILNVQFIEKLLFAKQGLKLDFSVVNFEGTNFYRQHNYISSNNSFFITTRKLNLTAIFSDLIFYTIKDSAKDNKIYRKINSKIETNLIIFIFTYPFKLFNIKTAALKNNLKWHIGYIDSNKKLHIVNLPDGEFWADPFLVKVDNHLDILFERMPKGKTRGVLSKYSLKNNNYHDILIEHFHLSFPSGLTLNNDIYIVPETKQNNKISLYKYNLEKRQLLHVKDLIENINAVDPVIIEQNDVFWLFCTVKSTPMSNSGDVLLIYYTDKLFNAWNYHPQNPIKMNNTNSRSAGQIFLKNNKLFRPVQNCSMQYGGSVKIMEITNLTNDEYSEKECEELFPIDFHKKAKALHSYSFNNNNIAIDLLINTSYVSK